MSKSKRKNKFVKGPMNVDMRHFTCFIKLSQLLIGPFVSKYLHLNLFSQKLQIPIFPFFFFTVHYIFWSLLYYEKYKSFVLWKVQRIFKNDFHLITILKWKFDKNQRALTSNWGLNSFRWKIFKIWSKILSIWWKKIWRKIFIYWKLFSTLCAFHWNFDCQDPLKLK